MTLTPITTLTTITTKTEDMKASTTFAFDFNSYNYYNYRNRGSESKHYVAIVPADLRSAGTLVLLVIIDRNTLKKSTRHMTLTPSSPK